MTTQWATKKKPLTGSAPAPQFGSRYSLESPNRHLDAPHQPWKRMVTGDQIAVTVDREICELPLDLLRIELNE